MDCWIILQVMCIILTNNKCFIAPLWNWSGWEDDFHGAQLFPLCVWVTSACAFPGPTGRLWTWPRAAWGSSLTWAAGRRRLWAGCRPGASTCCSSRPSWWTFMFRSGRRSPHLVSLTFVSEQWFPASCSSTWNLVLVESAHLGNKYQPNLLFLFFLFFSFYSHRKSLASLQNVFGPGISH